MNQDNLEREYEEDANEPPHTAIGIITAVRAVTALVLRFGGNEGL